MFRVPTARVSRAAVAIPLMVIVIAAALMGLLAPTARAAPAAPYFSPMVQVDQAPGWQGGQASMAIGSDGAAYLAYAGWGGTTTGADIFFTKSSDGRTWSTPIRVNDDAGNAAQTQPRLALDPSNNIYIVWTDARAGTNDVYFAKSTTGGQSFSPNLRVNDVTTNSQSEPAIAVDPVNPHFIHVVWTDARTPANGPDIYYLNSTDGGVTFNPPSLRLNTDIGAAEQGAPAIAVAPDRSVDVVWRDPRNAGKGPDIYFRRSTDFGITWGTEAFVNHDTGSAAQTEPTIAVNATGAIFVAWTDGQFTSTAPDIAATVSTNGGAFFAAETKVNDDTAPVQQANPSLMVRGNKVQLAWSDYRNGGAYPYGIYTASSSDGLRWSANMKVNGDTGRNFESNPAVGVDAAGDVFVAWTSWSVVSVFPAIIQQAVLSSVLDVVAPTADAGPAVSVNQGTATSFDGSASSDNLGIATSQWEFGDGSSATGLTATHTYADAGTYSARLTVWDASGNAASATRQITVRDTVAPVARGGGDRSVDENEPLFFDGSASTDNVGVMTFVWDFGDGSPTATTATATHVYTRPGAYTAKLTVTDAAGNSATSAFTVTVRSSPLLGLIILLGSVIGVLALVVALLGWVLLGIRKKERRQGAPGPVSQNPGNPSPRGGETDPLDMTFPPAPPRAP